MGASSFVLKIIEFGYCLPFLSIPEFMHFGNHSSAREYGDFVSESVSEMLAEGCIEEVGEDEVYVCSPLGVVDNGKKLRLIIDLRYVNKHLVKHKFKLEDMKVVANVFQKNDFVVSFDLKSGYHHIPIDPNHQGYLAFQWEFQGVKRFFKFTVLPFGLATAPYVFTKVTRVLVRRWRSMGLRCQLYMDDGLGGDGSFDDAQRVGGRMKSDLEKAGFVVNERKSCWVPSQKVEALGLEVNFAEGRVKVSTRRVQKFKALLYRVKLDENPTARDIARVIGHIISMHTVVSKLARLRTRYLYAMVNARSSWFSRIPWTSAALDELSFWVNMVDELNDAPLWHEDPSSLLVSWSDASDSGWGGFTMDGCGVPVPAQGLWDVGVISDRMSSTWRELRAVVLVLESIGFFCKGRSIIHRSDNQAAVHILNHGSRLPHLQEEALEVDRLCRRFGLNLTPEWVPRDENQLADFYSKLPDDDDWALSQTVFSYVDSLWGPHTIDCFASLNTAKVDRYCSRFWNPGCLCADAFTRSWQDENVWLTPPFHLIFRAWEMLKFCQGHGTLLVPQWVSAPWWPLLFNGETWSEEIKAAVLLPDHSGVFERGSCSWNAFDENAARWPVWVLRICYKNHCFCWQSQ